jgi:glycosyltransferase involved in cell wall biosynthesis
MLELSVVIPTHNPDAQRLRRTFAGLKAQTLDSEKWEIVLIDNASTDPILPEAFGNDAPVGLRLVDEPQLGLSAARRRGFVEARAPLLVLVDDDNVLAPDYLEHVVRIFSGHPGVGAIGGKSLPDFERAPPAELREFLPLLALRELGCEPIVSRGLRPSGFRSNEYPVGSAPIGAGMAIRSEAARQWLSTEKGDSISDRRGGELSSGGDNDIVLSIMEHGWEVAYFPELVLTHIIPAGRLDEHYLARLNRGIQRSWMQVLTKHQANPWPSIAPWTVPLRKLKAWVTYRAWSSPAAHIRWQGACGHFEGRAR